VKQEYATKQWKVSQVAQASKPKKAFLRYFKYTYYKEKLLKWFRSVSGQTYKFTDRQTNNWKNMNRTQYMQARIMTYSDIRRNAEPYLAANERIDVKSTIPTAVYALTRNKSSKWNKKNMLSGRNRDPLVELGLASVIDNAANTNNSTGNDSSDGWDTDDENHDATYYDKAPMVWLADDVAGISLERARAAVKEGQNNLAATAAANGDAMPQFEIVSFEITKKIPRNTEIPVYDDDDDDDMYSLFDDDASVMSGASTVSRGSVSTKGRSYVANDVRETASVAAGDGSTINFEILSFSLGQKKGKHQELRDDSTIASDESSSSSSNSSDSSSMSSQSHSTSDSGSSSSSANSFSSSAEDSHGMSMSSGSSVGSGSVISNGGISVSGDSAVSSIRRKASSVEAADGSIVAFETISFDFDVPTEAAIRVAQASPQVPRDDSELSEDIMNAYREYTQQQQEEGDDATVHSIEFSRTLRPVTNNSDPESENSDNSYDYGDYNDDNSLAPSEGSKSSGIVDIVLNDRTGKMSLVEQQPTGRATTDDNNNNNNDNNNYIDSTSYSSSEYSSDSDGENDEDDSSDDDNGSATWDLRDSHDHGEPMVSSSTHDIGDSAYDSESEPESESDSDSDSSDSGNSESDSHYSANIIEYELQPTSGSEIYDSSSSSDESTEN
jgi:hypothetical protein